MREMASVVQKDVLEQELVALLRLLQRRAALSLLSSSARVVGSMGTTSLFASVSSIPRVVAALSEVATGSTIFSSSSRLDSASDAARSTCQPVEVLSGFVSAGFAAFYSCF